MTDLTQTRKLREFIYRPESRGDYNIVWGGIANRHRPEAMLGKRLTQMTIREVLAWQDSIDRIYMSEAAGVGQIMEDTLRGLYPAAGLTLDDLFSEENQDRLVQALLERRGLSRYIRGEISDTQFANKLAREWASLPVVTGAQAGRSYYAGDSLNKAHVAVKPFLEAVKSVKAVPIAPIPAAPPSGIVSFFRALWAAITRKGTST